MPVYHDKNGYPQILGVVPNDPSSEIGPLMRVMRDGYSQNMQELQPPQVAALIAMRGTAVRGLLGELLSIYPDNQALVQTYAELGELVAPFAEKMAQEFLNAVNTRNLPLTIAYRDAFTKLGKNALAGVPALIRSFATLSTNEDDACIVYSAIAGVGPAALPALKAELINNQSNRVRLHVLGTIGTLDWQASEILPELEALQKDIKLDEDVYNKNVERKLEQVAATLRRCSILQ